MERRLGSPVAWARPGRDWDWIAGRLGPFGGSVSSVVPVGFAAYARILHPAEEPGVEGRLVRWSDVARWAGVALQPDAQFHTIALPAVRPAAPPPWRGQGPTPGRLYPPDADVLAAVLRRHTSTPEECRFGLWDGYGPGVMLAAPGSSPEPVPDPIPADVREGPRLHLPARDYVCFSGPVEAITAPIGLGLDRTANLAWPRDRAWFVASEIDLPWTYVAGSVALVEAVLAEPRIEALPTSAADPVARVEAWVAQLVERAVVELLQTDHVVIDTSMGTVRAWLERPSRVRSGAIRIEHVRDDGSHGSSFGRVHMSEDLQRVVGGYLETAVVGLVELR